MAISTNPHNAYIAVQRRRDNLFVVSHGAHIDGVVFQARTPPLTEDEASFLWPLISDRLHTWHDMSAIATALDEPTKDKQSWCKTSTRVARLHMTTDRASYVCGMLTRGFETFHACAPFGGE